MVPKEFCAPINLLEYVVYKSLKCEDFFYFKSSSVPSAKLPGRKLLEASSFEPFK